MGVAQYEIVPVGKMWGVQHDGKIKNQYLTKESAFEAAAVAASMAIKQGHEIRDLVLRAQDVLQLQRIGRRGALLVIVEIDEDVAALLLPGTDASGPL